METATGGRPLNEAEARALAREILRCPGWMAYAAQQPFLNSGCTRAWWVRAHYSGMHLRQMVPITSRAEWEAARLRWGD
jgi:hypothetical protein